MANLGALSGLRIIDLVPNRVGAQISQFFADFGADVIQVEPVGGLDIRRQAAYPFWARGKQSIVLDVANDSDREILLKLIMRADILIETSKNAELEKFGLGHEYLATHNPRLIHTSVTSFGRLGPYADAPGYEGLVHAKLGVFKAFQRMSQSADVPPFVNVPFASFAASQVALHGTLAALIERERSGLGQLVETNLAQGFLTLDTWVWFEYLVTNRWPDAFIKSASFDEQGRPASPLLFMLLIGHTKDGSWLQFAAVAPHLYANLMKHLGLAWMFTDDEWKGLPLFGDDADKRQELWTRMLVAAREKTLLEWEEIFASDADIFAEQFRSGAVALDHPQLIHDDMVVDVIDSERGRVRQPGSIVKASVTPADVSHSAPMLDEHREIILSLLETPTMKSNLAREPVSELPLAGITVLELATLFAAPHGTTMLTDLGAKVIKVEPLEGDRIRSILPFPELGGLKVMQGKQSIAIDLSTPEGIACVRRIAASVDVVVQGYRAGAMKKMSLDYESIKRDNPNVIYVNAPGYGVDGPYGRRPAYAPSIGAASGIPLANIGSSIEERPNLTMEQIQDVARRLSAASAMANAQADGFAALGVSTAILFGIAARDRGAGGQELFSSMLNTGAHAMSAQAVTFPGAPLESSPDNDLRGLGATYRIYDAKEGFVFLATPSESDWSLFTAAVADSVSLSNDERFGTSALRHQNTSSLVKILTELFVMKSSKEWESELLPLGIGCVDVSTVAIEEVLFDDSFGRASGYVTDVVHPMLDEHPRLAPYLHFSRSRTQALPAVLVGQQTDAILSEVEMTADQINDLRSRHIVG